MVQIGAGHGSPQRHGGTEYTETATDCLLPPRSLRVFRVSMVNEVWQCDRPWPSLAPARGTDAHGRPPGIAGQTARALDVRPAGLEARQCAARVGGARYDELPLEQ